MNGNLGINGVGRRFPSMPSLPKLNTNMAAFSEGVPSATTDAKDQPVPPKSLLDWFLEHVTFYRLHLAAFTFVPLIASGVFYASNGRFKIPYIDCLFICYSCMTVTGLSTINLSTLTVWQQVILYFLMIIGDITTVSWVMVLIRKRFFRTHCEYTETIRKRKKRKTPRRRRGISLKSMISSPVVAFRQRQAAPNQPKSPDLPTSPDPAFSTALKKPNFQIIVPTPSGTLPHLPNMPRPLPSAIPEALEPEDGEGNDEGNQISDAKTFSSSPAAASVALPEVDHERDVQDFGLTSVENFHSSPAAASVALPEVDNVRDYGPTSAGTTGYGVTSATDIGVTSLTSPRTVHYHPMMDIVEGRPQPRRGATMLARQGPLSPTKSFKERGVGGFPGPINLVNRLAQRAAPRMYNKLERKMTITSYRTLDENKTSWLNFSGLVVGRNSDFRTETLSDEQVEDLGGAEYRALRLLSYLVPAYFITTQLTSFILFGPWMSTTSQYDEIFEAQPRLVNKTWYSLFQVMGAYTGGGTSLVDMGMVPFQTAYLMIFGMMLSILAGNHALPIFMRFIIWVSSKLAHDGSGFHQALTFLLDHPRRCYLYLFPSHQTWFLLITLAAFSVIEWGSFLILNIGIPAYESIPAGVRVLAGLFQGLAVRASGFSIVPLASMAPALLFLYVVMMYIAIYPVAVSIRSTNVYEERSLGVFEAPPDDEDEEPEDINKISSRKERIGRYVGWHVRRQMSIDIWWLVWAVFLVCIAERGNLMDEEKKWFDLFRVIFELVSAFGGIGLTLGVPYDNFSFVGSFKTVSKLVVIVIMIRGRHRGLPLAVDRAVQLPRDMVTAPNPQRKATMMFNEKQDMPNFASPQTLGEMPSITRTMSQV
ncbi:TrkH-domain-containing protein [Coprinellus micaceus]|uniref:TrkH-domain-containing protein n=1 Tax=Coprinellus micaceus TaxID=71717 RepID=A0A4Y7TID0_COPMI|nr:TrkH-domain-containing protein [Coprinellus micaceus]